MLSRFIPLFVSTCAKSLKDWKAQSGPAEMTFESKKISFSIITRMMFGDDVNKNMGMIEMEDFRTLELK